MTWGNDTSHTWVQCQPAHQGWVYFYLINTWRRSPSYVMIDNSPSSLFQVLSSVTVSQPPGNPNQQRIGQWQQLAADWTITAPEKNTINCKGLSWILERPIIMILVNNFPRIVWLLTHPEPRDTDTLCAGDHWVDQGAPPPGTPPLLSSVVNDVILNSPMITFQIETIYLWHFTVYF